MVELGDIVRGEGARYLQARFATSNQCKAMRDIARCRTQEMGSVAATCDQCRVEYRLFRSCRNRSCPLCQSEARANWLAARKEEILPVPYLHVVFTIPTELDEVALRCSELFYDALLRAAGQAVIETGFSELNIQLGCHAMLHTWGESLMYHVHVHCVVPCGGFSRDRKKWVSFDQESGFPRQALSRRFRSLLCRYLQRASQQGKLDRLPGKESVDQLLATVAAREWTLYAKAPFSGPEKLFAYLAQYTYRVAITNDRIESFENHRVTFWWRDYRDGEEKFCNLDALEFLRRFLMHVPPKGFVRIRSYGLLGNRNRKQNIELARQLLRQSKPRPQSERVRPIRLCPACSQGRYSRSTPHFASCQETASQVALPLRSPPDQTRAA